MANVAELSNVKALGTIEVSGLIEKAFKASAFAPAGIEDIAEDVIALVMDPSVIFLLGSEENELKALAIIDFPTSGFALEPHIIHFYNEGSAELKTLLVRTVMDRVKEKGYTKFWGSNMSGKSDIVWKRSFKQAGSPKKIGTIWEFSV